MTDNNEPPISSSPIGLLGAGAQANEIVDYCEDLRVAVSFFAVNSRYITESLIPMIDITAASEQYTQLPVIAAVGAPAVKKMLIDQWGGDNYARLIAKSSWVSKHAELKEGVVVSPKSAISRDAIIGNHVLINLGVMVNHDVAIDDFSTVSPGVHIGGRVQIGKGVFLGIGSTIRNGKSIANGSIVGAGAVVIDDLDTENGVYVGCPAKLLRVNDDWLVEVV